ncbi:hypothetical protein DKG77_11715 [Flagellimonas aquimarina]|uniref:Uncharacterized protein n=1 Tax=Flagellimonas aquimarina TaxID=2201895 RepID=A0A316L1N0_9FLAO|nr:hypothetical protein DKG77_11715 [Allomuricauda koreensis]
MKAIGNNFIQKIINGLKLEIKLNYKILVNRCLRESIISIIIVNIGEMVRWRLKGEYHCI